jgi:LDH2 family malate/lactate/ureidoglycolate dehydrogenase
MLGNQAYAMGCPSRRHQPLILDGATTTLSWVAIHGYEARGEAVPPGTALNADGEPTTDPAEALAGLLLPAGHKGFGLALMWEVLTGILSGGEMFGPKVNGGRDPRERAGQSTLLLAIDPSASLPYETFLDRVDMLIDRIDASPRAAGVERIVVPGERSGEIAGTRGRDGIPLPTARVEELQRLSRELGVELPDALASSDLPTTPHAG